MLDVLDKKCLESTTYILLICKVSKDNHTFRCIFKLVLVIEGNKVQIVYLILHLTMARLVIFACIFYTIASNLGNSHTISRLNRSQVEECKIVFFENTNFNGTNFEHQDDTGSLDIQEHSVQTFGACCWRIYRYNITHWNMYR